MLPLLPIVVGAALAAHRSGALALALGLAVSFTAIGLFAATIGFGIGLDAGWFRIVAAVLLAGFGLALLSAPVQARLSLAGAAMATGGDRLLRRLSPAGFSGQLVVGLVLGAVWSPCVGPTLGAASLLAARGQDLAMVAAVMLAFGLGAALPLLLVSRMSRAAFRGAGPRLAGAARVGRSILGAVAVAVALLVLTGTDHRIEAVLVAASPAWLTDLTTRF